MTGTLNHYNGEQASQRNEKPQVVDPPKLEGLEFRFEYPAFHFTLLDFEFDAPAPVLPCRMTARACPWNQEVVVTPDDRMYMK